MTANYAPLNASNTATGGHSNSNARATNWQPHVDYFASARVAMILMTEVLYIRLWL